MEDLEKLFIRGNVFNDDHISIYINNCLDNVIEVRVMHMSMDYG
jgi:hypothetical protein